MRRIVFCIGLLAALFGCLSGCTNKHVAWQEVDLGTCGGMKIPTAWQYYTEDDILYIVDENDEPIMIECETHDFYMFGTSNKFFSDFRHEALVSSTGLSNGAIYGKEVIVYQDMEKEVLYLHVGYDNDERYFIVWDDALSIEEMEEIASTYSLP